MVDSIFVIAWLAISIQLMVPISITCFGELICEKSGTLNIGVEGCMLLGAFATAFTGIYTGSIILGFFAGLGTGILCGLTLTVLYLIRNMDQIVSGLMFNLFAFGLAGALHSSFLSGQMGPTLKSFGFLSSTNNPILQIISQQNVSLIYMLLIFLFVLLITNKTWLGLHIKAAGERPLAIVSSGKNILLIRFIGLMICSILAASAGSILVASSSGGFVPGMTAGRGFIALGIVVLARWNPISALLISFIFALIQALQFVGNQNELLNTVSPHLWNALPYIAVIGLLVAIKGAEYPKAVGIPLKK